MSITTGRGDGGETGLIGPGRFPKDYPRFEAYGTVDELGAAIGAARAAAPPAQVDEELAQICSWLFSLGSDLATPDAGKEGGKLYLGTDPANTLKTWIDRAETELTPLSSFILSGGTSAAAALHLARTVCRRAERRVVTLNQATGEAEHGIVFLNRLSDLLFLHARKANQDAGVADVEWSSGP